LLFYCRRRLLTPMKLGKTPGNRRQETPPTIGFFKKSQPRAGSATAAPTVITANSPNSKTTGLADKDFKEKTFNQCAVGKDCAFYLNYRKGIRKCRFDF
jgi:hypothetical protein